MNMNKLKVKLFEKGLTYSDVAEKLDISVTAVSNKLNGQSKFNCAEATIISNWLELTVPDRVEIFLN